MNIKIIFPLLILLTIVLGCGRLVDKVSTPPTNADNTSSAPSRPQKVVDVPSLVGKSRDELRKALNDPATDDGSTMTWEYPTGSLRILFTPVGPKKRDQMFSIGFKFKPQSFGNSSISGTAKAEDLGDMAGIDIHGKMPTRSSSEAGTIYYDGFTLNGKTVEEVSFEKTSTGAFNEVSVILGE